MKCRIILDKPNEYKVQVKAFWTGWTSVRDYAQLSKHMDDTLFSYTYDSSDEANRALEVFYEEYMKAKGRKRTVIFEGTVEQSVFLGKI